MALSLFSRFQDDASWSLKYLERPWAKDRQPMLRFVRGLGTEDSPDEAAMLPDEEWLTDMRSVRFAPGLFDRMMRVHEEPEGAMRQASEILLALRELLRRASSRNLARLYEAITQRRMSETLGALEDLLAEETFARPERVRAIARLMIEESPDRDTVKVALIALHAVGAEPEDAELAMHVGRHGEFTRFAAPVVCGRVEGWERFIWEMAKAAPGHGRSSAVQHLKGATDPEIQRWLLQEGWRESAYDESAAFVCATTGGLDHALATGTVTLEAAGGLLQSLSLAGVFELPGLRQLPNGPDIVERFVLKMAASEQAAWQFGIARSIHLFVASSHRDWKGTPAPGWSPELRARIANDCARILRWPGWEDLARRELLNPDERTRGHAYTVAHLLHLDLWEHWWHLAQSDPEFDEWSRLTFWLNDARVDEFVSLAKERLNPGSKPDFPGLGSLAMSMAPFPGKGWEFVKAAVWTDNGISSIEGLRTMGEWSAENWTPEMRSELERTVERHPEAHVREFALAILSGEWQRPERLQFDDEPEVWET